MPASKSMLQRALALALISQKEAYIHHFSWCDDSWAVRNIVETMGFKVEENDTSLHLIPTHSTSIPKLFSVGESGLALRMMIPILSCYLPEFSVKVEGSLRYRDVSDIQKNLSTLGLSATYDTEDFVWQIKGRLKPQSYLLDGRKSSQLVSGILMALGSLNKPSELRVKHLVSQTYVDLTMQMLKDIKVDIQHQNYERFYITPPDNYPNLSVNIEGDWSAAAFFMVIAAVRGHIALLGLNPQSKQADRSILEVLQQVGAQLQIKTSLNSVEVKHHQLKAFDFDATHCPDLFPPLAVLACFCEGESKIKGINRLANKESDRATAIEEQLTAVGVEITRKDNAFVIKGSAQMKSASLKSYNDHRMVMSAVCLALLSGQNIHIDSIKAISKSYPRFITDLQSFIPFTLEEKFYQEL